MGIPSAIYLFWHPLDKYCKVCQDNIHLQQSQYQVSTAVPCRLQGMCPPKSESHVGFEQREKRHEKMILKSGWQIKSKKNHWISKIPSPFLFSSLFIVFWNHENVLVLINVHSRGLVSLVSFFDHKRFFLKFLDSQKLNQERTPPMAFLINSTIKVGHKWT